MDDDTPNTQANPQPTIVQIRPCDWQLEWAAVGTLVIQVQVMVAIDFYREPAL